jgi:hypothetical protein
MRGNRYGNHSDEGCSNLTVTDPGGGLSAGWQQLGNNTAKHAENLTLVLPQNNYWDVAVLVSQVILAVEPAW